MTTPRPDALVDLLDAISVSMATGRIHAGLDPELEAVGIELAFRELDFRATDGHRVP